MTDALVAFLKARLNDDAQVARRAGESFRQIGETGVIVATEGDRSEECASANWAGVAEHIVRQDPARALREVEAKRGLLTLFTPSDVAAGQPRETDQELHARGAHPEWEYRTTEGPRKQWDDQETPPRNENGEPDPSWEPNVDMGRDGWDRFDYTEEAYWRRRLPPGQERTFAPPLALRLLALPYADHPDYRDEWAP